MEKVTIELLIQKTADAMKNVGFGDSTIRELLIRSREFMSFAEGKKQLYYSEELVLEFLKKCHQLDEFAAAPKKPYHLESAIGAMRRLSEYYTFGGVFRKRVSPQNLNWANDDIAIIKQYIEFRNKQGILRNTLDTELCRIQKFYDFIKSMNISRICNINSSLIKDYVRTMAGDSPRYAQDKIQALKFFLKFLYTHNFLICDLSVVVPQVFAARAKRIPAVWTNEEIETLLAKINRASPVGKRDYAVLVLTTELGLRASDINHLKLTDFNWQKKEINIVQHKTGKLNVCPLSPKVGWAIIDYLKYGRPNVESPFVFLTATPPYKPFGETTAVSILIRYMRSCGIHPPREKISSGMHALRHSLARRMLEKNIPLETISNILGHSQVTSTSTYLRVDINGMKSCLLSIEEVMHDEK